MALNMMCLSGITDYNIPGVNLVRTEPNVSRVTDLIYYAPIRVSAPINVTEAALGVDGEGGTGATAVVGIYSADFNLEPDGSPLGGDITIDVDTLGVQTSSALDIDLEIGTYLVSLQVSETTLYRAINGTIPDTVGFGFGATFGTIAGSLTASNTFDGTNPAPAPAADNFGESDTGVGGFDYLVGLAYTII